MQIKLRLDGQNFDGEISGLDSITIEYPTVINGQGGLDESGSTASTVPKLTLTGSAKDYVMNKLVNSANRCSNQIDATLVDTCCDLLILEGQIKPEQVEYCDDICTVEVTISGNSQEDEALRCVKRTLISQDDVPDANGLTFRQRRVPSLTFAVYNNPSGGFFSGNPDSFDIQYAMAIPVIDYLQNVADHCGLTLNVSPIFGVFPYNNMALFSLPSTNSLSNSLITQFQTQNTLLWTGEDLLNNLARLFNMQWAIVDGAITIAPEITNNNIIDFSKEKLCWSTDTDRCSIKRFRWIENVYTSANTSFYDADIDINDPLAVNVCDIAIPFEKTSIGNLRSSGSNPASVGMVNVTAGIPNQNPNLVILTPDFRARVAANLRVFVSMDQNCVPPFSRPQGNQSLRFADNYTQNCGTPNMFDQFWINECICNDFFSKTKKIDCSLLRSINSYNIIRTNRGDARIIQYNTNFNDRTIDIQGKLLCV